MRWYVARLKAAAAPKEVYVHRSPRPGVTLEVDFGESWAEVAGVLRKVKYVVATLPYSNVYFAKAYPVERLESLLDGIQAAFAYMGGVTDRVVLDNTTIAVKQVLTGRDRVQTDAFQASRRSAPSGHVATTTRQRGPFSRCQKVPFLLAISRFPDGRWEEGVI